MSEKTSGGKTPAPKVKVRLAKPHIHAGTRYTEQDVEKGVDIEVTHRQARWLKDQGTIKDLPQAVKEAK